MSSNLGGFTGRYATALYELAAESGKTDEVAKNLQKMKDLLDDSADLRRLVFSPAISRDDQGTAMIALLKKAKADALTIKFIGLVASNGRLFALPQIIDNFLSDLAKKRGEVSAEVISAIKLDSGMQAEVKEAVSKIAGSDKISLSMQIDESLIGGLIVRIGSRMIDTSIKTKLSRLEMTMKGVG